MTIVSLFSATMTPPQAGHIAADRGAGDAQSSGDFRLVASAKFDLTKQLDHLGETLVGEELPVTIVPSTTRCAARERIPLGG